MNKQISEIVGEALERYLEERADGHPGAGVVEESWATLKLGAREVEEILEEEDGLLDS